MNKKGQGAAIWIAVIVLVGIGLIYANSQGIFEKKTTPGPGPVPDEGSCADPSNTMTIGPVKYVLTPSNTTAESSRVFVDGVDQGTKTDGSTMTIGHKKQIDILYGYGSNSAYTNRVTFNAPCEPFSTGEIDGAANELLIMDGALTVSAFNSDTGNKNAGDGADNETIGSGETGSFDLSFSSADKSGVSGSTETICNGMYLTTAQNKATCTTVNKGKVHAFFEVNGSMYDQTKTLLAGSAPSSRGNKPSWLALAAVDDEVVEFIIDGCPQGSKSACDSKLGKLQVSAKTGENPVGGGVQGAAGISLGDVKGILVYENFYLNTRTGKIEYGIQKDDGTETSTGIDNNQVFYLSVT